MNQEPFTVIIDYGIGNVGSIANMIKRLGYSCIITSSAEEIKKAQRIILCGVGAFDEGMYRIESMGIKEILQLKVIEEKTPLLGICLGMQLLTLGSEEGTRSGLGFVEGFTRKFNFRNEESSANLKVPHMGWNMVQQHKPSRLLCDMYEDPRFYFVHSYHVSLERSENRLLSCTYGYEFTAAFEKENIVGVQFHPEKSHKYGLKLYKNFIEQY
jgi:imidazole glycerol-phosphate synthase subunit HisH